VIGRERERKGKREEERVEPQSSTARSSCGLLIPQRKRIESVKEKEKGAFW